MLWAPVFTVPGEHGKTPCMPLGINSMAGTDVCHTRRRRRRRNLPRASDIKQYCGRLPLSGTHRREQQDLVAYVLSLIKPSPSSIKRNALSPNRGSVHSHTITELLGSNLEHTFEHLAHSGAPVTLGPSNQSPTGPFVPTIFLPSICSRTANFEHLGLGIKSPTDSNWM